MNNSDYNDFNNWQNGDDNEMNNPNNWFPKNGFFYYNGSNEAFRKMWENIGKEENPLEHKKEYLHIDDVLNKINIGVMPNFRAAAAVWRHQFD